VWVIVIGGATIATIAFTFKKTNSPSSSTTSADTRDVASPDASAQSATQVDEPETIAGSIERPTDAAFELGVMTEKAESEIEPLLDPSAAAGLLEARHCGDTAACDAVRALVLDGDHVSLEIVPSTTWHLPDEPERAAADLSPSERESLKRRRIVVVRTSGPAFPKQLPARTGFALAAALAEKIDGVIYDQVIERIERPATFLKHVITEPLDAPVFRADRIDVQYTQRDRAHLRLLTTGLARFGCPDVDVGFAYARDAQPLSDVLGAVAEALVNGAKDSPLVLSRTDLEHARGSKYLADPKLPALEKIQVGVENIDPEEGDPNDFMTRIVPAEGTTPEGYAALATKYFGAPEPLPPEMSPEAAQAEAKARVDRELSHLLDRIKGGATLYLQFAFPVPPADDQLALDGALLPDAELDAEWMWIEVRSFDAKTVTGLLVDEPHDAPDLTKGQTITRLRSDALDYQMKLPDGAIEGAQ
jgi:hypothetical protein